MIEHNLEENREYYEHDALCDKKTFTPLNERGLKTCLDCAGVFDAEGKGVAVTDKRFDENYVPPVVE
jgi:hypothetical protein